MKKNLVILDEFFPFLNKEPFLETEINFYNNCNVYIFACSADSSMPYRKIKNKNIKFFAQKKEKSKLKKVFRYINAVFSVDFFKELLFLLRNKKFNLLRIKQLLSFLSISRYKYKWIKKELVNLGINQNSNIIFYSYWMHFHAYTALLLKNDFKNSKVVTRCHGFDLYEYRNSLNYIPLRKKVLSNIDEIYSISEDGKSYLTENYPNIKMNIKVSKLGTIDYGLMDEPGERNPLKIVSCSWVVPVKRLDRIINALQLINDIDIEWTHYGDGELLDSIKNLASLSLGNKTNITYHFKGSISNQQILEDYLNEQYHLFINVSESEGIPVSIMEAISFGIPVIAPNVGGVKEIVVNNINGMLLAKDFTDDQLINAIKWIADMSDSEYSNLRQSTRKFWEDNYSANKNYSTFIENIV
ncbi:glycosyltransferase [Ureibacillus suwonensis]|uniref:Glycosyltransferase n=1 Tax=Ureibacillus suwonensis TaxID=313007 RepID=A0ABW0RFI5_9BACL